MGHDRGAPTRAGLAQRPQRPLPASFIGREREMEAARAQLLAGARLLTLTGPPGVGKTRLALELVEALRPAFADGVVVVPLALMADPEDVPLAIANAAGLSDQMSGRGGDVAAVLAAGLRDRQTLLVLDNFEHVAVAAPLVSDLLGACERLAVLTTSRAPLRLTAERELPVPPLSLPDEGDPTAGPLPGAVASSEAVRLFLQCAQRVRPGFALTTENAADVAALCRALDGLPLAIELAAARVRVLSPGEIARGVAGRLTLLGRGARDAPARHQTLRAAIDWSYGLLSPEERTLFRRLAVFASGFDAQAAGAVWDPSVGTPADAAWPVAPEVVDLLAGLAEQSLLAQHAVTGRLSMLELVRAYALERLAEAGEVEEMRRRHARYFCALAEEAEPPLKSRHQAAWIRRLREEHANLRAALGWLLERARRASAPTDLNESAEAAEAAEAAEWGLRLSGSLWWYWHLQGHNAEGREWLGAFLDLPSGRAPTAHRARALYAAGFLAWSSRFWVWESESPNVAQRRHEEALGIFRAIGDRRGEGYALWGLALALYSRDIDRQVDLLHEALEIFRQVGDDWGSVKAIEHVSNTLVHRKKWDEAYGLLEDGNVVARRLGEPQNLISNLRLLGDVALRSGDLSRAREYYVESHTVLEESGLLSPRSLTHAALARLALAEGDPSAARWHYLESYRAAQGLGSRTYAGDAVLGLSATAAREGESERALRLAGAVSPFWQVDERPAGAPLPRSSESLAAFMKNLARYRPWFVRVRDAVGDARAMALIREGARLPLERVLESEAATERPSRRGPSGPSGLPSRASGGAGESALPSPPSIAQLPSLPSLAPLSPREAETAALIAQGLSNREIANRMTITERTVMRHVEHILDKLSLRSRTQIAVWVLERSSRPT